MLSKKTKQQQNKTRIRGRCIQSNRPRSVSRLLRLSRIRIRALALEGKIQVVHDLHDNKQSCPEWGIQLEGEAFRSEESFQIYSVRKRRSPWRLLVGHCFQSIAKLLNCIQCCRLLSLKRGHSSICGALALHASDSCSSHVDSNWGDFIPR